MLVTDETDYPRWYSWSVADRPHCYVVEHYGAHPVCILGWHVGPAHWTPTEAGLLIEYRHIRPTQPTTQELALWQTYCQRKDDHAGNR